MAKATVNRIALNLILVSLKAMNQAFGKGWNVTKTAMSDTKARIIVDNKAVRFVENKFYTLTDKLQCVTEDLRNEQFVKEAEALQRKMDIINKKLFESKKNRIVEIKKNES